MDFNERVIPGVSSNFMYQEALARYEFAAKYVERDMKVLDLGCGTGYGSKVLAAKGARVLAIDNDVEAIEFARRNYSDKNIKFRLGDVTKLKVAGQYDLICSFEVIEHLKNPKGFVSSIFQILKPGGVFIMSTPNAAFTSPLGGVASFYHVKEYKESELRKLLWGSLPEVRIFGQTKSKKARSAWRDFLESQKARESVVSSDKFGLRKLVPKSLKEKIWKVLGNFVGRGTQETLTSGDFPIKYKSGTLAHYFVAVCQKSR